MAFTQEDCRGQDMEPLLPKAQRNLWLRYQVKGYTKDIVHDFEQRLDIIFGRHVNRVHVLDFAGLTKEMGQTLADRIRMVYFGAKGQALFTTHAWRRLFKIPGLLLGGARRRMTWRQFILALGLHTFEEMAEDGFEAYCEFLGHAPSYTFIRDPVRRLCYRLISYSIFGRGLAPEKVTATDLFYLRSMDQGTANVPYLLAQYLFRHAKGRKSKARMSEGYFIRHLAEHFGFVSDEGLMGLFVIACVLSVIDLEELVKLNICVRLGDTWAWVGPGPERQPIAAVGAPEVTEGAPDVDEGAQAFPATIQACQPPPTAALTRTMAQRLSRLQEEVHNLPADMGEQREVLDSMTHDFTWTVTSLSLMMDKSGVRYMSYLDTRVPYQRRRVIRGLERPALQQPHLMRTS
ncbi:hypothetical protein Tco_0841590 [Tanacetum coccineum]|uniref:Uncharacterized protein n=1 Tax=Tanacetum coccineum TaxID=301880 RepID=A0ABQ5B0P2_9ASTR